MKLKKVQEGKVKFWVPEGRIYDVPVFYNPEAELLRDISISAIHAFQEQFEDKITICDALAGTGIRGLRYAKEIKGIEKVFLNDKNPVAVKLIKKNIKENKLSRKCKASKGDANILFHQNIFNVIDLDPFGTPVPYLDSAARSIYHRGFLCVTATDQAPLCGTYPLTCLRKYGIRSLKTDYYPELGMRILITNIMLTLSKRERVFVPLLMHSTKHYFRVYGKIEHLGKMKDILKEFGYVMDCSCGNREQGELKEKCFCGEKFKIVGPLYLGSILDGKFCKKVLADLRKRDFNLEKQEEKLLNLLIDEADMSAFYYDLHYLAKVLKTKIPRMDYLFKKLEKKGFKVSRTHFCPTAIKTDADFKTLKILISS
ncbi:MAG: tRNA (guanine(10)-N(2))-dimethyltransferase [Candidatus Aenigmatarchaeota archaeon]